MDTGVAMFPTHDAIGPGALAALVEERGHGSLWFPEHTHIPASRDTPFPGGGEMPRRYAHTYDLFVAMTAAATATTRLRIASGICLVIERDPIITAKEVASIDQLSGGRVEFGVGAGWNREEMANHGTDPKRRFSIMRERVEAMKAIWTQDGGQLPRRARELRPHLVVPEADPAPAPARGGRRQRREGARPRAPLRRRVGAPAPSRQRGRADPGAAAARRGGRPRATSR